jgi:hypothetical protein
MKNRRDSLRFIPVYRPQPVIRDAIPAATSFSFASPRIETAG